MTIEAIAKMTDDELRAAAHKCEEALHFEVAVDPQSERHAECFFALYAMCVEMNERGMKPKSIGVVQ